MPRKRHSAEEIVAKLRQADVLMAQGQTGAEVAQMLGVTETSSVPARRMSMVSSSRERNRSCSPLSRRSFGCIVTSSVRSAWAEEITASDSREFPIRICKENGGLTPKTGKSDYFSALNNPARSIASGFFTDYDVCKDRVINFDDPLIGREAPNSAS